MNTSELNVDMAFLLLDYAALGGALCLLGNALVELPDHGATRVKAAQMTGAKQQAGSQRFEEIERSIRDAKMVLANILDATGVPEEDYRQIVEEHLFDIRRNPDFDDMFLSLQCAGQGYMELGGSLAMMAATTDVDQISRDVILDVVSALCAIGSNLEHIGNTVTPTLRLVSTTTDHH